MSASFDEVFPSLFARACRLAVKVVGDRGVAEEIAAEALTRAYLRWSTLAETDYFEAWVLRVAANLAIDKLRKRRVDVFEFRPVDFDDAVALRVTLEVALRQLPKRQREVVVLRHLADLPETEIVRVTGLSLGTVKTHLRRALRSLRDQLAESVTQEAAGA